VRGLPISRALQGALMRDAAEPLACVLRQGYAAASSRLEDQGVQPAVYRTIVVASASRSGVELQAPPATNFSELRDGMQPKAEVPPPSAPAAAVDQQSIELLSRLFDAIHDDPALAQSTVALLLRLQPTVLRIAVREPAMLEAFDHSVWRLMDQLAFVLETIPDAERERGTAYCRRLIDQLAGDPAVNSARFDWALSRLAEFDRHVLAQGIAAAQPVIARLRAAIDTSSMPLDVGTLDTIPAALLPDNKTAVDAALKASTLRPGDRLRAYLHGDWRLVQLLWSDAYADVWMLRDVRKDKPWALRGRALDRLLAEHLADRLAPRSLVRSAAQRVLRAIDRADGAAT
jgi:hypothetical protein